MNSARHIAAVLPGSPNPDLYRAAFVDFPNGTTTIINGLPGADHTLANAINQSDIVCGYSYSSVTGVPYQAYIWQNGQTTGLNLPFGAYSAANDIADNGSVCGWMGNGNSSTGRGFIWNNGQVIDLGVIPGGESAAAYGISPDGQRVCGAGVLPDRVTQNLTLHAFAWVAGMMTDIGTLPGKPRSLARAVNDSGVVIGDSYNEVLVGHAFVWRNGVMSMLNDLIPQGLQIDIKHAWAINNAGQIAAEAGVTDNSGDIVAVRLTPIPPKVGDTNCDWLVNIDDLVNVIFSWSTHPTPIAFSGSPDLNGDGVVNIDDLVQVITHWGQ